MNQQPDQLRSVDPDQAGPTETGEGVRERDDAQHREPVAHSLLLKVVRASFFILFMTVTLLAVINVDHVGEQGASLLTENYGVTIFSALGIGAIIVVADILTPRKKVSTLFAVFFALMGAMIVTGAVGLIIDLLAQFYEFQRASNVVATLKVLIGICTCYLAIVTVLQTKDDFRLVIPYVEFAKQIRGVRPMLLDTSILIDARIVEAAGTGILQAPLIIPRFVVGELQALADSSDKFKRAKGRRGLAVVTRLQRIAGLDISIDESPIPGKAVDQMLVELAQRMPAAIVTTDAGLARVAGIQNVAVINLNDLAAALRAPVSAGQRVSIHVAKAGEQTGQGVGYLEDGTMVVVEGGAEHIGRDLAITIGTTLQTAAGRLVFARPAESSPADISHAAAHNPAPADADPAEVGQNEPPPIPKAQRLPLPPIEPEPERPAAPPTSAHGPLGPGGRPRPTSRNPRR